GMNCWMSLDGGVLPPTVTTFQVDVPSAFRVWATGFAATLVRAVFRSASADAKVACDVASSAAWVVIPALPAATTVTLMAIPGCSKQSTGNVPVFGNDAWNCDRNGAPGGTVGNSSPEFTNFVPSMAGVCPGFDGMSSAGLKGAGGFCPAGTTVTVCG